MLGEAVFSERPREQHQQLARLLPQPAQGAPPTDGPLSTAAAAAEGKACLSARERPRPPRRAYCRARAGGSPWAAAEGQDFLADHASPDIDFATFHAWVDNWKARAPELQALRALRAWRSPTPLPRRRPAAPAPRSAGGHDIRADLGRPRARGWLCLCICRPSRTAAG
jgi:hypothetical protein